MKTEYIVLAVFAMIVVCLLVVSWYLNRYCSYNKPAVTTKDEHTNYDCVGCASDCFECVPGPRPYYGASATFSKEAIDVAKGMLLPHNIVYTIIDKLKGTRLSLEAVLSELGYNSTDDLSLVQLLMIDDRLYQCGVCDFWSEHSNPATPKFSALWKCPNCNQTKGE